MIRKLFVLLFFLSSPLTHANQQYANVGAVNEHNPKEKIVVLDGQSYSLTKQTIIHGMVRRGEFGPILTQGTTIGFNTGSKSTSLSEIWILN